MKNLKFIVTVTVEYLRQQNISIRKRTLVYVITLSKMALV